MRKKLSLNEKSAAGFGSGSVSDSINSAVLNLKPGGTVGLWGQMMTMLRKRVIVARTSPLPTIAIVIIPVIVAGIAITFIRSYEGIGCSPSANVGDQTFDSFSFDLNFEIFWWTGERTFKFYERGRIVFKWKRGL